MTRAGLTAYFEAVANPVFARISLFEVMGISPAVDQAYMANSRRFASVIVASMQATSAGILLTPIDEETVGMALLGAVIFPAVNWVMQGRTQSIQTLVDNCLKVVIGTMKHLSHPAD